MVMNIEQQKNWNEAEAERDWDRRLLRMTIFMCECGNEELKKKVCDYIAFQIAGDDMKGKSIPEISHEYRPKIVCTATNSAFS
ncbi:hypothetical protein [Syntrophus aciditrophicus]|uniref:Hypothetical cytosolic protein n=1 Tax=Syntrophus aciditrophicus (strain SB) TaxID=56780 RepID=Q2LPT5_SYNAS|nr:hypothetical protein [Syntrophus aciditrophicus]ABC76288.1 hypothetical cytosolic protein [Syntrophus aciditrophicus SB]